MYFKDIEEMPGLDWVWDSKVKSAYSASFGHDELKCPQDLKNRMRYFLRKFDSFSVRERSAIDLCRKEFDMDVPFVLDPVFICDVKHYDKLISKGKPIKGLCAYVLDKSDDKSKLLSEISNKFNLDINILEDATYNDKPLDMEDWLSAYATADYIVTDSFHGTCFSIIFNKPFVVVHNAWRGPARFKLLEEFGLMHRVVTSFEDFENRKEEILAPIDWDTVNSKIKTWKEYSLNILKESIKPKKKEVSDFEILNDKDIKLDEKFFQLEEKINSLIAQQNGINNDKFKKLEKMINKSKWFSKSRSLDGTHRIINILGFTFKQKRRIK